MSTAATQLRQAIAAHRTGDVDRAMRIYRDILAVEPAHARANHLLGFALLQRGAPADAVPLLANAVRQIPSMPDAWAHYGLALGACGRSERAVPALRRSLTLAPALLDAATGLLKATREASLPVPERAAARVVALAPLKAVGWHGLGLARASDSSGAPARKESVTCLRRAALLEPADAPAVTDLADTLRNGRDPAAALRICRWATGLNPTSTAVRATLSAILFDLDRIPEADLAARRAAVTAPGNARAYGNRAQSLYRSGRSGAAIVDGRRAAMADPSDPQIRANLGSYHLAAGNMEEGWRLFRDRPARLSLSRRQGLPAQPWSGQAGARLLVLAEQGLGDELLFATCWPDLAACVRDRRLAAALVEIDSRLRPLAERSYPEIRWLDRNRLAPAARVTPVPAGIEPPTHWITAGDLPSLVRSRIADFPSKPTGLIADSARVREFRDWLDDTAPGLPRFGFCWRSGLRTGDRTKNYPALSQCRALFQLPGMRLVVLQYDDCDAEIAAVRRPGDAPLLVPPALDRRDDLDGVAALIGALDGVISAETAVLALAGAVGAEAIGFGLTPGWVALGQSSSPWFPTLSGIYRAPEESWESAMARVAREVARRIAESKEPDGKAVRLD